MTSARCSLKLKVAGSHYLRRGRYWAPLWVVPLVRSRVEIKEDIGNNRGHLICQANDLMADNFVSALGQRLIELGLIHIHET